MVENEEKRRRPRFSFHKLNSPSKGIVTESDNSIEKEQRSNRSEKSKEVKTNLAVAKGNDRETLAS